MVIKLTNFKTLPEAGEVSPNNSSHPRNCIDSAQISENSTYVIDGLKNDNNHLTVASKQVSKLNGLLEANNLPSKDRNSDCSNEIDDYKEFKIVWNKLSFEVSPILSFENSIKFIQDHLNRILGFQSSKKQRSIINAGDCYNDKTKLRMVFKNLNGCVKSGELTAILGPSGAGKTSLLNAICGRTDNYYGQIKLLGCGTRKMRLSVIPQKDYLLENLTVCESLMYASKLLNTNKMKTTDHLANVNRVVKMLNLIDCLESSINSLSGGEHKRVSIAQELISRPDILILDEPTSGLDSLNCKQLIGSLAKLIRASQNGKLNPIAIVMTIHQPDIEVFNMFDHIYCMARGGRVIFDGNPNDVMKTIQLKASFEDNNKPRVFLETNVSDEVKQQRICAAINPANLLIEIASGHLFGPKPIESLSLHQEKSFNQQEISLNYDDAGKEEISIISRSDGGSGGGGFSNDCFKDDSDFADGNQVNLKLQVADMKYSGKQKDIWVPEAIQAPKLIREQRLGRKKRTNDEGSLFWYHSILLTKRAFLTTLRDPFYCLFLLFVHLTLPFVFYILYPSKIGKVKGCPLLVRNLDILALVDDRMSMIGKQLREETLMGLECIGMLYLTIYSFSLCNSAAATLVFPSTLHVLLKEIRNGWYKLSPFTLAKTIASLPFEIVFPTISIVLIYLLLGLPSSYFEWRLCGIAATSALVSMFGQTLGLLSGALFIDNVQLGLFFTIISSLPLVLLSGYAVRPSLMPSILAHLSWVSPYRCAMLLMSTFRFGLGMCPCDDESDFNRNKTTNGLPLKAKFLNLPTQMGPIMNYYLRNSVTSDSSSIDYSDQNSTNLHHRATLEMSYGLVLNDTERKSIVDRLESSETQIMDQMAAQIARKFAFDRQIDDCSSVKSQLLILLEVPDENYWPLFVCGLIGLVIFMRILLIIVVRKRINSKL